MRDQTAVCGCGIDPKSARPTHVYFARTLVLVLCRRGSLLLLLTVWCPCSLNVQLFMILRKSDKQVTALHVSHHAEMGIIMWILMTLVRTQPVAMIWRPQLFIHAVWLVADHVFAAVCSKAAALRCMLAHAV